MPFTTQSLLLLLVAFCITSCTELSEEFSRAPHRALVQGDPEGGAQIRFRTINGSLPLLRFESKLAKKVWLDPGEYNLIIDCFWPIERQKPVRRHKVQLTVEEGYDYDLKARDTGDDTVIDIVPRERE